MSTTEAEIPVVSSEPEGVVSITPSGLPIYYQWEPKRLYRIAPKKLNKAVAAHVLDDPAGLIQLARLAQGLGEEQWIEVPSVTTALDVLNKPALPWWGMQVGVAGLMQFVADGTLSSPTIAELNLDPQGVERVVELLAQHKLTVNHVKDTAAKRGTSAHDQFEVWSKTGQLPDPEIAPLADRGYIVGLRDFIIDSKLIPDSTEVTVASSKYGYAGRYDLRAHSEEEARVVARRTPTKVHYAVIPPSTALLDLKTSKHVYESHFLQLGAYEGASVECGWPATDYQAVLHVMQDGTYEYVRSEATVEQYATIVEAYKTMESLKGWKTRQKKGS